MNTKNYKLSPSCKEEQQFMIQQAKMAAMGEMIGNIAHQWRQPLNALSALNVGIGLKHRMGQLNKEEMLKFKQTSNEIIQNMSATIDDFKNFYKPNKQKEKFHLNDAIANTLRFVSDAYQVAQIRVVLHTSADISITGYKNELMQVLLNILNNSKDAIIENKIQKPTVIITTTKMKHQVSISIQDNAGGVTEEILHRLCEPYFTTKFQSHGTGIGLYMSKMIVEKSMKGILLIENKKDGLLTTVSIQEENMDWAYNI